jgi:phosphate-selective porin
MKKVQSFMKKGREVLSLAFIIISLQGIAQTQSIDSVKEVIDNHEGRINAIDERVMLNEADLGKLTKIKISGYLQAQWENFGQDIEKALGYSNSFVIRRARVKFIYEAVDGVKFVLQPDFGLGVFTLKDAYAMVNIPKLKEFSLWAGQFNRLNYEVEYSSSQREVFERSRVIRTIYPGEREMGVKLEYNGKTVPLKVQLAALNGNFTGTQPRDIDSKKDLMGRFVYSLNLADAGVGIDFGAHAYLGGNLAKSNPYVKNSDGTLDSMKVWSYLDKKWAGGEIQVFADVLGGMAVKAEYIAGVNSSVSTISSSASMDQMQADPNKIRNFAGYHVYLIKNIGKKNQVVARYDFYDPNTTLKGDAAGSDLYFKTWSLAFQHYLNDFIRISLNYEIPTNEINSSNPADRKDNIFGIRVQAKF